MGAYPNLPLGHLLAMTQNARRRRGFRGLGDAAECLPYDIATQLNILTQSAINVIGAGIEQGTVTSPADFAANLQSQAVALCSGSAFGCAAARCTVPSALIATLAAQYAAAYNSTLQAKAAAVAAGDICVPSLALFPGIVLSDRARTACGYGGGAAAPAASASAPLPPARRSPPPVSATGLPLGVTLQNASGGSNTQFNVGDTFRLVVTGPANSQVTGSSMHDGKGGGSAPFGSTDSSGRAVITGTMTADTVGGWVEQWYVGGQNAGSVSFSVVAPAAPAAAPPPAGGGTAPPPAGSMAPATTSGFDLSFLTQNAATVGGTSIPWWFLLAAGGVALYAFSGSRGKR